MLIRLIGVAIVVVGLILKFDTIATVVLAGIVTGLVGGMSVMDILTTLGNSFVSQRTATLFVLTLPAIGICERFGLKEKAIDFIRSIKSATAGRVIIVYEAIRTLAAAFSIRLGGHPQFVRPVVVPMAEVLPLPSMVISMTRCLMSSEAELPVRKTMVTSSLRTASWVLQAPC